MFRGGKDGEFDRVFVFVFTETPKTISENMEYVIKVH